MFQEIGALVLRISGVSLGTLHTIEYLVPYLYLPNLPKVLFFSENIKMLTMFIGRRIKTSRLILLSMAISNSQVSVYL